MQSSASFTNEEPNHFKNCKINSIIMYIEIHWKAICNIIIFKITYILFKLIFIKISNGENPN